MRLFIPSIKLLVVIISTVLVISCAPLKSPKKASENTILGRYLEYILVIENGDIAQKANDFLSKAFYDFAKDELENKIDLTQRGAIQFTYMPLGQLKSYEFKESGNIYCLKLNGIDINQRKISLLIDYVLEDGTWKINKYFAGYLDNDLSYDTFPPCTQDAFDSI